jgi:hypothetical protein
MSLKRPRSFGEIVFARDAPSWNGIARRLYENRRVRRVIRTRSDLDGSELDAICRLGRLHNRVVAPLIGNQPLNIKSLNHCGQTPAFVREEAHSEVQAVSASYDSTLKVGAQTPFSDQLSHKWAGGMWESDPTHNSVITAGNGGTSALSAGFTLYFANGTQRYDFEKRLAPAEQMWIDVRRLKDEKIPDIHGSIVPQDADMRSYAFEDLTNVGVGHLYEGKVVCDAINGHVTYGCAVCCGYNGTKPFYYPINVPLAFTAGDGI